MRFAFYGRMSTSEHQGRHMSRLWQREMSELLVEGARGGRGGSWDNLNVHSTHELTEFIAVNRDWLRVVHLSS
ncbi:hypothetical protein ALI22I_08840 [Saccharothrix sp. ALI-22-I]|nr:hypothetical protein ALI22I_08840 [Saccharothrix sp. ALI-22-I]